MNTNDLINKALKLAKLDEMPHDTNIIVEGENIKRVLIGVDMETPELLLAKELGSNDDYAGRIEVLMAGGTNGGVEVQVIF